MKCTEAMPLTQCYSCNQILVSDHFHQKEGKLSREMALGRCKLDLEHLVEPENM